MTAANGAYFFRLGMDEIRGATYKELPIDLREQIDIIIAELNSSETDEPAEDLTREELIIDTNPHVRYVKLDFQNAGETYFLYRDSYQWDVYSQDEFESMFYDGDDIEDVYIPPETTTTRTSPPPPKQQTQQPRYNNQMVYTPPPEPQRPRQQNNNNYSQPRYNNNTYYPPQNNNNNYSRQHYNNNTSQQNNSSSQYRYVPVPGKKYNPYN